MWVCLRRLMGISSFQMEVLDENEWWNKIGQMKTGGDQEMVIKRNFSRGDQQTLSDMAYQMGLYL